MAVYTPAPAPIGATITTPQVARLAGLSQSTVLRAARDGRLTIGGESLLPITYATSRRTVRWPAAPLLAALGIDADQAATLIAAGGAR